MDTTHWLPGATLDTLRQAARLRQSVRQWMLQQGILEVFTPALSAAGATDPHVASLRTRQGKYLQTSPEFPMKRLLAAHALELADGTSTRVQPDLYQIATVFRAEESGRYHNSEFSLLEWYRIGRDHHALMQDLENLLRHIWDTAELAWPGIESRRYGVEVRRRLGVWPEQATTNDIARYFASAGRSYPESIGGDVDAALDLFIDEFVLPEFAGDAFTLLIDYPVSQCALARLGSDEEGRAVARRFELYFGRLELANGFHELCDATIQRSRFEADLRKRDHLAAERISMDENLLQAMAAGLPDCAGIALGLERLHMVLGQHAHIREVMSFDEQRA
ncbi:MAG: EF-P lysine aminoacylase GenX [Granulosicoccus sp.]|nr:EF-P lysine aminoacylase GenX [Granulosicoccus sp.]